MKQSLRCYISETEQEAELAFRILHQWNKRPNTHTHTDSTPSPFISLGHRPLKEKQANLYVLGEHLKQKRDRKKRNKLK